MASLGRQYDMTVRALVKCCPQDFVYLALGHPVPDFRVLAPELPASERTADWVVLVRDPNEGLLLLHVEFQTEWQRNVPFRMLEYRVRIRAEYHEEANRVYSVVVLLTDEGYPGPGSNRWEEIAFGEQQLSFEYREVRLWEMSAESVLQHSNVGLIPLLPLMQGASAEMLQAAVAKLAVIPDEELRAEMHTGLFALGGLKFSRELLQRIIRREAMKRSVTFDAILSEGRAEGSLQARREAILRVLRRRFGRVPDEFVARLSRVDAQTQLDDLLDLAVGCAEPGEFDQALAK